MAIRDSWHRTLVYFGLADEPEEYEYETDAEPESVLEDRYRERPNVRRLQGRRRRDDFDDIFADDDGAGAPARPRQAAVLRAVSGGRGGRGKGGSARNFAVQLATPKSFIDAQRGVDKFLQGIPLTLD